AARLAAAAIDYGAALGVAAWCVGRLVSDRYAWSQWLLWIPTPAAIALAVVGLLAAARPDGRRPAPARRRPRRLVTWLAVLVALAGYLGLIEHRYLRPGGPPPNGVTFVHWNMVATRATPRSELAATLVREDADVTIITNPTVLRGEPAWRSWIEDKTDRSQTRFAVVSRLPLRRFRALVAADGILVTLLELDATASLGRPLVTWLVDLPSDPVLPRMEIAKRARRLIEQVNAPPPDLIIGDFNMTRGSASLRRIAPGHRHAFDLAGSGYGATYPVRYPLYHIDHVLVGPGLGVADYRLIEPPVGMHRLQRFTVIAPEAAAAAP
ncbi:MAG: endonuclease/exonuclease/phosphatase family protein, partial [Planctomycetota bacterium]